MALLLMALPEAFLAGRRVHRVGGYFDIADEEANPAFEAVLDRGAAQLRVQLAVVGRDAQDRRAHSDLERLVGKLRESGHVRGSAQEKRALEFLLVLTSYVTFRELPGAAGLSDNDLTSLLQATAKQLLSYVEGGPEPTLHVRR